MPTRNTIEDKYTRPGFIEPIDGLYEGLAFDYRPMLPEQVEDFLTALERTESGRARVAIVSDTIAAQVVGWSEVDREGKPLAIEAKNVSRLPYSLLMRFRGIVEGRQASDLPKGTTRELLAEWVASKLLEAQGKPAGLQQVIDNQKNS